MLKTHIHIYSTCYKVIFVPVIFFSPLSNPTRQILSSFYKSGNIHSFFFSKNETQSWLKSLHPVITAETSYSELLASNWILFSPRHLGEKNQQWGRRIKKEMNERERWMCRKGLPPFGGAELKTQREKGVFIAHLVLVWPGLCTEDHRAALLYFTLFIISVSLSPNLVSLIISIPLAFLPRLHSPASWHLRTFSLNLPHGIFIPSQL